MPELLSDAWFEALGAALARLGGERRPSETAGDPGEASEAGESGRPDDGISIGQVVTGVPGRAGEGDQARKAGEVRYTIVLGADGSGSLVRDSTEHADVVLVEDWATAKAIASGEVPVSELLSAGRIKMRGESRALVSAGDMLGRVAPLIAGALAGEGAGPS